MTEPAHCRSCDAEIGFAISDTSGRANPIDWQPTPAGNVAVRRDEDGVLRCRPFPVGAKLAAGEKRGTSHFATCPNADQHRRG